MRGMNDYKVMQCTVTEDKLAYLGQICGNKRVLKAIFLFWFV
jgi:hypothetical protein